LEKYDNRTTIRNNRPLGSVDSNMLLKEISDFGNPRKTVEQRDAYWKAKALEAKLHLDNLKKNKHFN
jgi:hypothetical protein